MSQAPSLRLERHLLRNGHHGVLSVDEVGRGSLCGPVSVGVVVIDPSVTRSLPGVRDSKLLSPAARERLVPLIATWAADSAVGHASAAEIDARGLTGALRLAAGRAVAALAVPFDVVLLDGSHDWLTPPPEEVARADGSAPAFPAVVTRVKADRSCTGVAAASVLAKVERDDLMRRLAREHPGYALEVNKGYGSPAHLAALRRLGPCAEHRRSWRLPAPD